MASEEQHSNGHSLPSEQQGAEQGPDEQIPGADEAELLWKLRKYLMLLAILVAAITYQAGLAPPGGFWQDNQGHIAGDVVLRVSYPKRYLVFFYCNTTAFGASLIVLLLLLVRELSRNAVWLRALQAAMLLGLLGLMGAYAAGSCRELRTSVYIWVLLVGIFAYITFHVVFYKHLAPPCLKKLFNGISTQWKNVLGNIFSRTQPETPINGSETEGRNEEEELERKRSFLLVLATLAATVTYVAGLSPPGGFWADDKSPDRHPGDPVLRDHYPRRYNAFSVCNATAFAGSLVIIIMLLSDTAVKHVVKSNALRLCVLVSLFGLMGAYAAGSCREVRTSIFVFSLVGAVLLYLVIQWIGPILIQWIKPIVQKSVCISNTIECLKNNKCEVIQKLSSFISGNSDIDMNTRLPGPDTPYLSSNSMSSSSSDAKDDLQKLRTYLLLLGILAATVTYQAGLNPPGGFWTDSVDGHIAGDPILETINPRRYKAFFYCNATAFVASVVIITLLQSQLITVGAMKRHILQTAMTLDLFGLMGAYAAGSSRKFSTSLYVFVLVLLVFAYVVLHILLSVALKTQLNGRIGYISEVYNNFTCFQENITMDNNDKKDLEKRRKFLMLLAILAASITYQAGVSPPGGFWTDNKDGHRAGDPVFRDEFRRRYRVFFYFNATAFMASLAVIMLLVSRRLCQKGLKCYALRACVLVDLISLLGAFAAGSCRKVSTSVFIILVVIAVFLYVMIQVLVLKFAKDKVDLLLERVFNTKPFERKHPSMSGNRSNHVRKRSKHKWRKDLMLIGTLAVTVTYQAGLLPPGGLWQNDQKEGFLAGDPILHDTHPTRYRIFFYSNATAFMASILMVILLLNNTISKYERSLLAMKTAMILVLLGLLVAYAAGSCRKFKTSAYIFALVIAVFIYIAIHVLLSFDKVAFLVRKKGKKWMPCLKKMWELLETEPSSMQPSARQPGEVVPIV